MTRILTLAGTKNNRSCLLRRTMEDSSDSLDFSAVMSEDTSEASLGAEMDPFEYQQLKRLPGNNVCLDCGLTSDTEWGSVTFGVVICADCSLIHQ